MLLLFAVGVGQEPEAVPLVRGTNVVCAETSPFRIVPDLGQRPEYAGESSISEGCNVLHDDVAGS
jgi:hypothetical protein